MVAFRTPCFSDRSPRMLLGASKTFNHPASDLWVETVQPDQKFWFTSLRTKEVSHTHMYELSCFSSWVLYLINTCNFSYMLPYIRFLLLLNLLELLLVVININIFYYIFDFVVNFFPSGTCVHHRFDLPRLDKADAIYRRVLGECRRRGMPWDVKCLQVPVLGRWGDGTEKIYPDISHINIRRHYN